MFILMVISDLIVGNPQKPCIALYIVGISDGLVSNAKWFGDVQLTYKKP